MDQIPPRRRGASRRFARFFARLGLPLAAMVAVPIATPAHASDACPAAREHPANGVIALLGGSAPDGEPYFIRAGGPHALSRCPRPEFDAAYGYFRRKPDFRVDFWADGHDHFEIVVRSPCNAVLLVKTPDGRWRFNDEDAAAPANDGQTARLAFERAWDGVYEVWVGAFGPWSCSAQLVLRTRN